MKRPYIQAAPGTVKANTTVEQADAAWEAGEYLRVERCCGVSFLAPWIRKGEVPAGTDLIIRYNGRDELLLPH